ncbi:hypothetical protein NOGI109294_17560 [Nocardiopsis gilva]
MCGLNELDRPFSTGELLSDLGLALDTDGWRHELAQLEAAGATEVVYQPAGADVPRELESFAKVVGG